MSKAGTLRGLGATHAVVDIQSLMQCLTYNAVSYSADNYTFSREVYSVKQYLRNVGYSARDIGTKLFSESLSVHPK